MGNFNLHYDNFLLRKNQGRHVKPQDNIFEFLENISIFDTTILLYDIDDNNPKCTFIRKQ